MTAVPVTTPTAVRRPKGDISLRICPPTCASAGLPAGRSTRPVQPGRDPGDSGQWRLVPGAPQTSRPLTQLISGARDV